MPRLTLFSDKEFYRGLFAVALPIALQNLIGSLVNALDTVMIGRLGTVEIAAVGLGNQVFFLLNMVLFGIGSGSAVFVAQFWGKKDLAGIRRTAGLCLSLGVAVAAAFSVLCRFAPESVLGLYSADPAVVAAGAVYLRELSLSFVPFAVSFAFTLVMRSVERVRLPVVATLISLMANLVLNWLLIFGIGPFPALGVLGAARATVISRLAETVILVSVSYARSYPFAGSLRELFGFDRAFIARFLGIALPVVVNETIWALGISAQNVIMARTGTGLIAAYSILNTISQLAWVFFMGLGNGAAVLIGKRIGQGEQGKARDYASLITRFAPLTAAGVALLLIPLSLLVPILFRVGPEVAAAARIMFALLALSYPFRAFNMSMIIGVCRAGGDTIFGAVYDLLFLWTVAVPGAALASFVFAAPGPVIYLCFLAEEPLKAMIGLHRLRSGKWLHDVTR
jgi:putative MATE family efflux protein